MGRPKAEIVLSDGEREQLETWTRRRKTAQALALRSRVILACASRASIVKSLRSAYRFLSRRYRSGVTGLS